MRTSYLLLICACAAPLLEPERAHCLNSLECESQERCIQQQCMRQDAGPNPVDAGNTCIDPDDDGAHETALALQAESLQTGRHLCPETPDRYRYDPVSAVQVHAWALPEQGPAPKLQIAPRGTEFPSACGASEHCAEGGRLTGLVVPRIDLNFDLGVIRTEAGLGRYEMGFRAGRSCSVRQDCGNGGRCVRAVAENPASVGTQGVCVFDQTVSVSADCDRTDRSSEQPESALNSGGLADFRVDDVPLCQNDNDWYALNLTATTTVERQMSVRSVAAAEDELSGLTLFVGIYSAQDLRPLRFAVLHFANTGQAQDLRFANLGAGDYRLRITQINRREAPITYTIKAP